MSKPQGKILLSSEAFIFVIIIFTGLVTYLRISSMTFTAFNLLIIAWLLVFIFLCINVAHMFACSIYSLIYKPITLPEIYLHQIPPTAIVYTIRAESCGLFERINYSFEKNYLSNVDLWIISGEAPLEFLVYEQNVISRLRKKYGNKIRYYHCEDPAKKKREMVEEWLMNYGDLYKYFVTCDADSMLPKNFLLKMIRKAVHPLNNDIAIFQSSIGIINAKTYYSYFQKIGISIGQRLYNASKQNALKCALYWGHNALVRTEVFRKIKIPHKVLSHDIWETVYLNKMGYRTVFCLDVVSYEESPSNYLEDKKRILRWIKGNFETYGLIFEKDISLANRFYVFYGIYGYLTNIVFFLWVYSGMFFEGMNIWRNMLKTNLYMSAIILSVIFLHKLAICDSTKDIGKLIYEIFISTVISLNSIFYISFIIMSLPFRRQKKWVPMKKNPYEKVHLWEVVKEMWLGTAVGLISLYIAVKYTPVWGAYSTPIIGSLILSIPIVYLTSQLRRDNKI